MSETDGLFPTLYRGDARNSTSVSSQSRSFRIQARGVLGRRLPTAQGQRRAPSMQGSRTIERKTTEPVLPKRPLTSQSKMSRPQRKFDPVQLSAVTKEIVMDPIHLPNSLNELQRAKTELEALRKYYSRAGKFEEAQDTQRAFCSVVSKIRLMESRSSKKQAQREKYAEVKAVVGHIMRDWDKNYDEFVETSENQMRAIIEAHRQELEAFDETAPAKLSPKYKRISPSLREMRGREKALTASRRYSAAKRLKRHNDEEEKRQEKVQFNKMQDDWLARRRKLIMRQEEQLRVFVDHAEATRMRMLQNRHTLVDGHIRRMNLISVNLGKDAGDLENVKLSEERERVVSEIESAYPVPRMRGPAFTSVRQQQQSESSMDKKSLTATETSISTFEESSASYYSTDHESSGESSSEEEYYSSEEEDESESKEESSDAKEKENPDENGESSKEEEESSEEKEENADGKEKEKAESSKEEEENSDGKEKESSEEKEKSLGVKQDVPESKEHNWEAKVVDSEVTIEQRPDEVVFE